MGAIYFFSNKKYIRVSFVRKNTKLTNDIPSIEEIFIFFLNIDSIKFILIIE